eukprot:10284592-Alexandrium_andersonii.AAC.1
MPTSTRGGADAAVLYSPYQYTRKYLLYKNELRDGARLAEVAQWFGGRVPGCLLYTSDAADDM